MTAQGLATGFTQVSYVVRDIDATAQWFERALGVEFFGVRGYKLGGSDYRLTAGGKPIAAEVGIRIALARAGGRGELEIELIQPDGGDSVFSKFVQRTGGGLHHVAFEVGNFDAATQPLEGEGMMPRTITSGGNKIAYFDCRGAGASVIEVAQYDDATRQDYQRLKSSPGADPTSMPAADPNAPRLVQISYTVRDLDPIMDWWKRVLGVEHFGVTRATAGRDYEVLIRDQPSSTPFSLRTAMGRLGPRGEQEIEIIQPVEGPSPYREFLEERGEGLNHVSFLVPDFEPAAERMRASGAKPLIEFRGHGIRACYFDCRAAGASIVEIGYFDEKATASLERVKTPRDKRPSA
ncbi:MAG TPA: VOC family protein [Candidatus Binataceae bacterium]|jgi:catechol 2,3-dioxygenase-like lactoylglutathione lyase family enzyme|nr:VOC family protein [Candidatus Binataceae bacterium]